MQHDRCGRERRRRASKGLHRRREFDRKGRLESTAGDRDPPLSTQTRKTRPPPGRPQARHPGKQPKSREIDRLWKAYRKLPCEEARNRLVEAYQPLVRQVVRRFAHRLPRSVDRGDLETAANVGLIAAVEGFDPGRGVRFESYCELRAKGALLDELRTQDWLPRPWRQKVEQHKRTIERLRGELGCEPAANEIAEAMGLAPELYRSLFAGSTSMAPGACSQVEEDSTTGSFMEGLPDRRCEGVDERLTREELLRLVANRLSAQEYQILYLKYWEELPMREIGDLTGLSESRVCKVHARLIERLRDRLRPHCRDG